MRRGKLFFNQKNETMETVKRFNSIWMIAILCLFAASCAKDNSSQIKSSKLAVNFSAIKVGVLKDASSMKGSSTTNGFTLNSVKINIAYLIIEENSGNDVEQQGKDRKSVV